MPKDSNKKPHCYPPDARLSRYMTQKLIYQQALEKKEAGETLSEKEMEAVKNEGSLRSTKSQVLDEIIFPAMANLTFFFESVARNPELQIPFEDDIKELLGVKRMNADSKSSKERKRYGFMFRRLVDSMVTHDLKAKPRIERRPDYRGKLLHIMQDIVQTEVQHHLPDDLSLDAQMVILQDAHRVSAWTATIAQRIQDDCGSHSKGEACIPRKTFDFKPV
jgi:hypothetical protein